MGKYYYRSIEETKTDLKTDTEKGLSTGEAKERLNQFGENRLQGKEARGIIQMLLDQFKDFLVLILIGAAVISIAVGEVKDGVVILAIVILNAILGVVQENRANNALKALKEMAAPQAKVLRDGRIEKVQSVELVPGDVVLIEAGDYIPADLRLVQSVNLKVEEAALTGESVPAEKFAHEVIGEDAGVGDRLNSSYMGTITTYGRGKGIVTETGMDTQMGKIATMLESVEEEGTPLQKKLAHFGKLLGTTCLIVCGIIFLLGIFRGQELLEIFMTAISLAVAAIPEGLPAVVTVVLALGMQRMIKKHAIIKRLSAVETLGSTTVICTDKTGTLTQNKMTVVNVFDGESIWNITGTGYTTEGEIKKEDDPNGETSEALERLMQGAVLCNDAELKKGENQIIGDPTEGALIVLGAKGGYPKDTLNQSYPRIAEIPFDSERKLMTTFHKRKEEVVMYTKGAPDVVLSRAQYCIENDKKIPITEDYRKKIMEVNHRFANRALRVLAVAYKELSTLENVENQEQELTFIGLIGMIDPPREEAKKAVAICKKAGIRAIMITGDHKITASAIGRELGIIDTEAEAMDGKEIDSMSEEQLKEKVKTVSVFSRVSPEHKVRLVEAVRANGEIAAMTGDGVNDAPALKRSDIGIAMGITGTDVAKEAADMILTDDNFASIVDAVEEGRTIYSNIRKFVGFLLSCNIGELLLIFVAMLIGWDVPLLPIQLLWINLVTDAFPAFALGMEEKEEGVMDQPPRNPNEPIVDRKMGIAISIQSIALGFAALFSFWYGLHSFQGPEALAAARTYCFITLVVGELLRAYSARSETISVFKMKIFSNRFLNLSVLGSFIMLLLVVYVPFLQPIFHTVPLSFFEIDMALLFAVIPVIGGEIAKKLK